MISELLALLSFGFVSEIAQSPFVVIMRYQWERFDLAGLRLDFVLKKRVLNLANAFRSLLIFSSRVFAAGSVR